MRGLLTSILAVLLVFAGGGVARADEALEEMLEAAATADFRGSGIVISRWDGDSAAATYEMTTRDGVSSVSDGGAEVIVGDGRVATRSDSDWSGLAVEEWSDWRLSDRYTLSEGAAVERLGRAAHEVYVLEDGEARARLIIDEETGAPLLAEVFDSSGGTYRVAALIEVEADLSAGADPLLPDAGTMPDPRTVPAAAYTGKLPEFAGWYRRADIYAGPGDAVHAFYSDGLFSFSVFETGRGATPESFENATRFVVNGKTYRRIIKPSQVWVQWHSPDHTYVLVGDLPPDHLEAVLGEFPEPGNRAFFVRLWRKLFG